MSSPDNKRGSKPAMIPSSDISKIVLPAHAYPIFKGLPELWSVGNSEILRRPLLAIVSAREADNCVRFISLQLIKELAGSRNVNFISGWHSQLEQECFQILLTEQASLVFCISKALERFKAPAELGKLVTQNKALLLTHCTPRAKRISRKASLRRNQLVVGLAAAMLVLSAPEGTGSFKLARAALDAQKPVFTLDDQMNRQLLDCGASVASIEAIRSALR